MTLVVDIAKLRDLPLIIVHDTILNDIYGEKNITKYSESAIFIQDYFLTRQASMGLEHEEKFCATTQQVIDSLTANEKFNTWTAVKGWMHIDEFTARVNMDPRTSVYVTAHHRGIGKSIILAANDANISEKILRVFKNIGISVKTKEGLNFSIKQTDELKDYLKLTDSYFYNLFVNKKIKL